MSKGGRISFLLLAAALLAPGVALAGPKDFVVYVPGMGGSSQQAEPYLKTFFSQLEKAVGWPAGSASGKYFDESKPAEAYIDAQKPGYGLVSQGMFIALACKKGGVEAIASVVGVNDIFHGGKYHLVAKDPALKDVKDLQGKKLVSNHLQNPAFVSRVLFEGKLDVEKYFVTQKVSSPVKPFKALDRGEADVALIDDAQLANMKSLPVGASLHVVYDSPALPPFPVVAFPGTTTAADRAKVRKALLSLCDGDGATVCKQMQITKFEPIDEKAFTPFVKQYCAP